MTADDESRFDFGQNWSRFLAGLNEQRIDHAKSSIQQLLRVHDLESLRFLDAGSGSGLFSLAAFRLGADVTSFDFDPRCVACTRELRSRFAEGNPRWSISQGSLLDRNFLQSLGVFDVVYCWGVAHHTGAMWQAIENLASLVKSDGSLVLAIYNDQQFVSRGWGVVKRLYQRLPTFVRPLLVAVVGFFTFFLRLFTTAAACLFRLLTLQNPIVPVRNWLGESRSRGMNAWHDLVDWVGGWPFEVARPEEIFRFLRDRGFVLQEMTTCSGHGCNEFVFLRATGSSHTTSDVSESVGIATR